MIELGINQLEPIRDGGTNPSAPSRLLQASWRIALVGGFVFIQINDYVSRVTKDRPWLWSLSIVIGGAIMVGIDRVVLRLYMKYARSIFDPEV